MGKQRYWGILVYYFIQSIIGGGSGSGRGNIGGSGGRGRGGGDRGPSGPSGQMNSMGGGRNFERFDRVLDKLQAIQGLPTLDLPQIDFVEKRFNGRSRLYVGNFTSDMTEAQLKEILAQYGEVGEMFYNKEKMFAFLRMGSRLEAEKAKRELDGQMRNGRPLKVRFAPHQGAIKVLNLGPMVSNELLHRAFSIFGDIERCLVLSDDRGRPKGEPAPRGCHPRWSRPWTGATSCSHCRVETLCERLLGG